MYFGKRGETMPIIKSSKKSVKTDKAQTAANNVYTRTVKNSIKKTEKAILSGNVEEAKNNYQTTVKAIDKACSKGLIKKNTCARQKSRLNKKVKEMA